MTLKPKQWTLVFLLVGIISLVLLLIFGKRVPIPLFVCLIVSSAILIPFGTAFSFLFSHSVLRKKYKILFLIISLTLLVLGLMSKYLYYPGANMEIILSVLWYCFAYAPLELKDKYVRWAPYSTSKIDTLILSSVDFIGLNLLILGILFKLMYWPFANAMIVWGVLISLAGMFSWNRKFKREVIRRKEAEDKIKEQYKEIQDSINYAKRIQGAILPSLRLVKQCLPQSFILYKPKDIVAGDFYWLEQHQNKILFAAADCTGHGVPGAMVSVVCNHALNRSVKEYGLGEPAKILDKTREIVIKEFEKSEEEVNDGMDISLCAWNEKDKTLEWAGANNPLWIVRKNADVVEEIRPNKQPIGRYLNPQPFTNHEILLNTGDTVYVFTDGYQDQFGGSSENGRGKKI